MPRIRPIEKRTLDQIKFWDSTCLTCKNCANGCQYEEYCMDYENCGIVIDQLVQEIGVQDGKVVCWLVK